MPVVSRLSEKGGLIRPDAGPTEAPVSRRVFPGEQSQLSLLREWLDTLMPDCAARHDVASVATELGSNAVRHTATGNGGWFTVEIARHRRFVRVAVTDCGVPPEPQEHDDPADEHGWGLIIVRGLSMRTGSRADHRGRVVWADVLWNDAEDADPALSETDAAPMPFLAEARQELRGRPVAARADRCPAVEPGRGCRQPGEVPDYEVAAGSGVPRQGQLASDVCAEALTEPVDTLGAEPVQPAPHRLRTASQPVPRSPGPASRPSWTPPSPPA